MAHFQPEETVSFEFDVIWEVWLPVVITLVENGH